MFITQQNYLLTPTLAKNIHEKHDNCPTGITNNHDISLSTNKTNKSTNGKASYQSLEWQDARSYVQAVEVKNVTGTLYVSGQTAIHPDGKSSDADMKTQLILAIENLEKVITEAGYEPKNIVRLNIYTISSAELWPHFNILQEWISKHGMKQAVTLLEVKSLFETLSVELEAT